MILEVSNVHAGYFGDMEVLKGVSLKVNEGEIVTIIGPNGAGKSTLFKTIFGFLKPLKGDIKFQGESIIKLKPNMILRRGISYVFQEDSIFPKLTVQENMEMGGFIINDHDYMKKRTEELNNMFPVLRERKNMRAQVLSGGERRMLVIARALMLTPKLLLLDEPTAGLAPFIMDKVFEQIKLINKLKTTIMIVEQNAKRSLAISDRAYVLVDGLIKYQGSGNEVLNSSEVRKLYLGETDFLP